MYDKELLYAKNCYKRIHMSDILRLIRIHTYKMPHFIYIFGIYSSNNFELKK